MIQCVALPSLPRLFDQWSPVFRRHSADAQNLVAFPRSSSEHSIHGESYFFFLPRSLLGDDQRY